MHRLAALLITIPLAAQTPAGKWSFGVYGCAPGLTGHYNELEGMNFDIKRDLNLKNNKTGLGVHMDYLGRRFGFSLGYVAQDFAGQNRINRQIEIGGQEFDSGVDVKSSLKNTTFDINGTVKILRVAGVWLGVNFGIQSWSLDVQAEGVSSDNPTTTDKASEVVTVPIPQIGLSAGFQGLQNRLDLRGKVNFLAYSGAKYTHFTADARYYVLPWLGVRAFVENHSFDAPDGSIIDDVEAKLDSNLFGLGVALRW